MGTVYLNGEFVPVEQAQVSVLDRGFLFGDGVYEVIPVFGGQPFRLEEHLDRLRNSLAHCRIAEPLTVDGWRAVIDTLIKGCESDNQAVYLQVTRGVAPREHRFPANAVPTVLAMTRVIAPPPEGPPAGIRAVLQDDVRWQRCDIKSTSLLANVLLTQQALDDGAQEALLVREGCVWEGASSNVFAVVDGQLITPPQGPSILSGVTRDLLVELCARHEIHCSEAPLPVEAIRRASEVWISSSTREMVPVFQLDDRVIGDAPGPFFCQLWALYYPCRATGGVPA